MAHLGNRSHHAVAAGDLSVAGITSRSLSDLSPAMRSAATEMVARCAAQGIDILVTCTYRDDVAQAALYAVGRTVNLSARRLTNAKPGESLHNVKDGQGSPAAEAFDVVPMVNGKCMWRTDTEGIALWRQVGEIGEACGLEWAGRWKSTMREFPHFQKAKS
jgi:peptidoglycan LD-endopeptidase CwlK